MKNIIRAILIALLLILPLAACGTGETETPTAEVPIEAPTNTPEPLPTAAPSTPCANDNFPAVINARWFYSSTGSPIGAYEFAERISDAGITGFTVASQLRKTPSAIVWECRPEGLAPIGVPPENATSILAFQRLTDMVVTNSVGVVIPTKITPGMEWTYSFDVQANQTAQNGSSFPFTAHVVITFKADNRESVTVKAGTYDCIPVEAVSQINSVTVKPTGDETLNLISNYTYWYAAGVGWVKASGSGIIGGQEYFETIELTGQGVSPQ